MVKPGAAETGNSEQEPVDERTPPPHERPWHRPWQSSFLHALTLNDNVSAACRLVGIAGATAYEARSTHPLFKAAWDEAIQMSHDRLERHLIEWATVGVPVKRTRTRTKTDAKGNVVEEIVEETESADRNAQLLILALRAKLPETYRFAERVSHEGADGGPVEFTVTKEQADTAVDRFRDVVVRLSDVRAARAGSEGSAGGEQATG